MNRFAIALCAVSFFGISTANAAMSVSGHLSHQAAEQALIACGLPGLDEEAKVRPGSVRDLSDIGVVQNFLTIAAHCDPSLELPEVHLDAERAGFDASTYAAMVSVFRSCGISGDQLKTGSGLSIFDAVTLSAAARLDSYCASQSK